MSGAVAALLPDGRLHLQHGPIDLIVGVDGPGADEGRRRAARRFASLLDELAAELPLLRTDIALEPEIEGSVGRAMAAAVRPFSPIFVTPMAAVAGAGADAVLAEIAAASGVARAYVNNGGDVAIHLTPGARFDAAIAAETPGAFSIGFDDPVRGVATSGWRGRSHSLGIADAVTVLARNAAAADAAATLIANAVDLPGHPAIERAPAAGLSPDSDLGSRLATVGVGPLSMAETAAALDAGASFGDSVLRRGLIVAAALTLNGAIRFVGDRALLVGGAD